MLQEKTIGCVSCGDEFLFSVEEQEFYQSKGFSDPKKCKPCREIAKQQRRGGGGFRQDRPREFFDAVCSGCGIETQVPFKPDGRKPVYCRDCFRANSSY